MQGEGFRPSWNEPSLCSSGSSSNSSSSSSLPFLLDELPLQRAWVEVDLGAIAHNVRQIRQRLSPNTDFMAVVKADAYGHGAVSVAAVALAAGATWLGVATVTEGIELRRAGITAPILLMGATHSEAEVRAIAYWHIQPTLSSFKQASLFSNALGSSPHPEAPEPLPVHLILDTGMSRLGVPWEEAVAFANHIRQLPRLTIASIYSHLATADDPDPATMRLQHWRYEEAIAQLRRAGIRLPRLHLANSAATLVDAGFNNASLQYNMVRIGLALYGLYPAPHLAKLATNVAPPPSSSPCCRSTPALPRSECSTRGLALAMATALWPIGP